MHSFWMNAVYIGWWLVAFLLLRASWVVVRALGRLFVIIVRRVNHGSR